MTIIPIPQKGKNKTQELLLIFLYPQSSHFLAHLYEHLIVRELDKVDNIKTNAVTRSGIVEILIQGDIPSGIFRDILLLNKSSQKDLEQEKKRIYIETLSEINRHRLLIHNLVRYQQKNPSSLYKHLQSLMTKEEIKKELIIQNLKLMYTVISSSPKKILNLQKQSGI
jgi:hypothetical protein